MKVLCDIFSFRYWRIPPLIHAHLDPALDVALGPGQWSFAPAAELLGLPGQPLHLLVSDDASRANSTRVKSHLMNRELPFGAVHEVGSYVSVASPALTLLTLASHVTFNHLVMLMHEACGTFSVYRPSEEEYTYLQDLIDRAALPAMGGWKPVLDASGHLTDLWQRPPLATLEELESLARAMPGAKGRKNFEHACGCVHEGAASPLESRIGMRFGMVRRRGGEGVRNLKFNHRVVLSRDAQRIAHQRVAYIDVLLQDESGEVSVGIEGQSHLIHDRIGRGVADGDRATALMSMGYNIVQLSHENVMDQAAFAGVRDYVLRTLGITVAPKTERLLQKERELIRDLSVDWGSIGLV